MRLTKFTHACVRLEHAGGALVLDPGGFGDAEPLEGASAVLITHEHFDHYSADHLRTSDAPIYTVAGVAAAIAAGAPDLSERVTVLAPGEQFTLDGVAVAAVGAQHAVIHPDIPLIDNSGFLIEVEGTAIFHPGDALTVPEQQVDLLLVPSSAPWLKASEAIDFVRAVGAARNVPIHDAIYTPAAHGVLDTLMGNLVVPRGLEWTRVAEREDVPGL